jgi:hypothetical protein
MTRHARLRRALIVCAAAPCAAWAVDPSTASSDSPPTNTRPPGNEQGIYLTAGLGETDNVALVESGAQSQTFATVGVLVDYERKGPLLSGTVKGGVDYFRYLQNAFPGQAIGRLDGNGSFAIVPDRVKWVLQDDYGSAQVDALTAQNPQNIQSVNVVSTGPDVELHPTDNSFVRLGGRYAVATWQTSPFNNKRTLASLSIGDELSLASSVSLNADFTKVSFQNTTVNPDYDRRKFFGRYETRGVRTSLSLDLGVAQVDDTGTWRSKGIVQALLSRDLTPFQSIYIAGGQQYTDTSDSFQSLTAGAAGNTIIAPGVGAAGNYLSDSGNVGWRFKRDRTSIDLSGRWERDRYTIEPSAAQLSQYIVAGLPVGLDATRRGLEGRASRQFTRTLSGDFRVSYSHESFDTLGFADHSLLIGFGLTVTANPRLEYRLRFDHTTRAIDSLPALTSAQQLAVGFTENRVFLTAAYRLSE